MTEYKHKYALIIDGDDTSRRALRELFVNSGDFWEVYEASDIIEGRLRLSKFSAITHIFCETNLPDGKGYDLIDELSADLVKRKVRIIAMADDESANKDWQHGHLCHLFVSKPFNFSLLKQTLHWAEVGFKDKST